MPVTDELEQSTFFAPANEDAIDGLVSQHQEVKAQIQRTAHLIAGGSISYFIKANREAFNAAIPADKLFDAAAATKALDADYWKRAGLDRR